MARSAGLADGLGELGGEPALADACGPENRHDMGPLFCDGLIPDPLQQPELVVASDEGLSLRSTLSRRRGCRQGQPGGHGRALALQADGLDSLVLDDRFRRPVGLFADEHTVHGGEPLQSRGRVDHVSGDQPFALRHVGVEGHDRLARVDRDAHLQVELGRASAQLGHPVPDRERRAHRPLRVVPVRHRRAEDAHHRVADELLDRSSAALDLRPDPLEVRRLDRPHVLGIELLRPGGEADQIGEHDGDDLPFFPRTRSFRSQAGAAIAAEFRVGRILPAAVRACAHAHSVRTPRAPVKARGAGESYFLQPGNLKDTIRVRQVPITRTSWPRYSCVYQKVQSSPGRRSGRCSRPSGPRPRSAGRCRCRPCSVWVIWPSGSPALRPV